MARPLIQRTTEELSALFDEWRNDPAKLRVLVDELQHRDRPRAVKLREQVERVIHSAQAEHTSKESKSKQDELPLSGRNSPSQPNGKKGRDGRVTIVSNEDTDAHPA